MRIGTVGLGSVAGALLLGLVGCGEEPAKPGAPAATPGAAAGPAVEPRKLSDASKAAMKEALSAATTGKKVWFLAQPGNNEVAGVIVELAGVFKEAGWEVFAEPVTGVSLKPGVMTLVAEEQYPPYIDAVLKAMDASGLGAKSASGYRAYFESKKQENAAWPGVPMKPDQDFVIVVGPKPTA